MKKLVKCAAFFASGFIMLLTFAACGEKKQESFSSISVSSEEETREATCPT